MSLVEISGYEHVGIRVTDRDRSVAFYERLGFRLVSELPEHKALVMTTPSGVSINLIYNGSPRTDNGNVLMDEPEKHPGVTHPAFIVPSLDETIASLEAAGIAITERIDLPERRFCFVRDPDNSVLEFDELLP